MAASIIFLSAGTRRVFQVEIFLSRDVAPVSAMCIVSSTSSICSSSFCWCFVCLDLGPAGPGLVAKLLAVEALHWCSLAKGLIRKLPYPLVTLTGCCFPTSTTFTMSVGSDFCFSEFHFIIQEASSTSLSYCSSTSVTQDSTPIMIYAFRI